MNVQDRPVLTIPLRPGYGKSGKTILLRANHFPVSLDPAIQLYTYDVVICPEVKIARQKRRLFELLLEVCDESTDSLASNYENMVITNKKLGSDGSKVFDIVFYNKSEKKPLPPIDPRNVYQIRMTYDGILQSDRLTSYIQAAPTSEGFENDKKILQALQSILVVNANKNSSLKAAAHNSKFYPIDDGCYFDLGGGVVAIKGYYASLHAVTLRPLANVNVRTSAFYDATDLRSLIRASGKHGQDLEYFVKGLRIVTSHTKDLATGEPVTKERSVVGFSHLPNESVEHGKPSDISFILLSKDGHSQVLTVADYFKHEYQHVAQLDIPVVNIGNKERPIWTPAEMCLVLPAQLYRKTLSPDQVTKMTECGVVKPANNARRIVGMIPKVFGSPEAFGLKLDPTMVTVQGHVLTAPRVSYGAGPRVKLVDASRAKWNLSGQKFTQAVSLEDWTYLVFARAGSPPTDPMKHFADIAREFKSVLEKCGMKVADPFKGGNTEDLDLKDLDSRRDAIDDKIRETMEIVSKTSVRVLWVVLPSDNRFVCSRVKYWGDCVFGLQTICTVASTLKLDDRGPNGTKARLQVLANEAMKFNAKGRGVNQVLPRNALGFFEKQDTMLVGIDVTHPGPDSLKGAPSIAGVVASIDKRFAQFPASIRLQDTDRREMVEGLKEMMIERLRVWSKHNGGRLPVTIVVYRDGVSDSQYTQVLECELSQIKDACTAQYPANEPLPRIAVIIVGKRHDTRFLPVYKHDGDRLGNPPNGTIVDRAVTLFDGWDFYLQAHNALDGTVHSAHYVVIYNEFEEFKNVDVLHQLVSHTRHCWMISSCVCLLTIPADL